MSQRMIGVRVSITRYLSDEPQPGIVECEFIDAHGHRCVFVDKTAIFSAEYLDANTSYPQPGVIGCEVVSMYKDFTEREIVLIDTEYPWGQESLDDTSRFEVLPSSLIEWEWGTNVERAWNGNPEPNGARVERYILIPE